MAATLDARIRLDSSQFSGGLNRAMRETNVAVGKMSSQFGTLRNVLGVGLVGSFATDMLRGIMQSTMEAEKLQAAMTATTGSAALGRRQLEQVRALSGEIGLDVANAAKSMIQFQSAGMSSAEAMATIKAGYNAILSTGGGSNEFSRFSIAIQQLRTSPKVLQEELNQLREALPTTAKLMQEAFGVQRAEDIQKLGISGKEFVETMLLGMQKLPQIGDTMEKAFGRMKVQFDGLKASIGEMLKPGALTGMAAASPLMETVKAIHSAIMDAGGLMVGVNPEQARAGERMVADMAQAVLDEAAAKKKLADQDVKDAASKNRSIEQGQTLSKIFGKFNDILREGAKAARDFAAELDFEDRMNAFSDQERRNDWEAGLDETKRKTAEAIQAKREAQADAMAASMPFYGPEQMSDDEREDWRNRIAREGMTPSDRKAERAAKREQDENTRKAADRKTREQMREIEKEKRANAFDDLKKNKGFFDEEGTKRKLREKNRADAKDAVQSSAQTLTDIKVILERLATA